VHVLHYQGMSISDTRLLKDITTKFLCHIILALRTIVGESHEHVMHCMVACMHATLLVTRQLHINAYFELEYIP
jgi:hypothetical protein